jgi:hypothetical protein
VAGRHSKHGWTATAWDAQVFGRAAGAAAATLVLAWLVTAATDEGGVPWGERAGRTLPLAPLCAALGVSAALSPARWRGETGALAALGRSRAQIAAGAVAGGAGVAVVAALLIGLVGRVDVTGFYPTATHASGWRWDGAGFVDAVRGLRVAADGVPRPVPIEGGVGAASLPVHARAAAAMTTALSGLALSMLLGHVLLARAPDRRFGRRDAWVAAWALAAVAASVVLFQSAAAHQLPALSAVVPALALLGVALQRYRASP